MKTYKAGFNGTLAALAFASFVGLETVAAQDSPAPPEPVTQDYQDWRLSCVALEPGKRCSLVQRLTRSTDGAVVFVWSMVREPDGSVVSAWDVPTGLRVDQGMAIDIGGEQPLVIPYRACDPDQCQAAANLGEAFMDELVAAEAVTISVIMLNGQRVNYQPSTKGLAEGLAAMRQD